MYFKFCLYGFLKNQRFFDPFIILFFREMGMSFLDIGILFSIREVSTNILEIPTGVIADAFGRRKSMFAAFLSYLVSFAVFYFFPHFFAYSVAMVLFASGEAFRSGTHKAMILQYLRVKGKENMKVEYYGHTRSVSQFGSAISSLIAIAIVFHSGSFRPVFLLSMIPYAFGLILMLTYPKYLDGDLSFVKGSWRGKIRKRFTATLIEFKGMFKNKEALKAISNSSVFDGFFKSSKDYLQPILKAQVLAIPVFLYLADKQRIAIIVGSVYFLLYVFTSIASRNASWFAKKMKSLTLAINLTYIIGGLLLLTAGVSTLFKAYGLASVLFIVFYVIQNLRRPMNVGYISDNISHKAMASGLSVESQLKTLIMAVLAPAIGFAADTIGIGLAIMITSVIFLLIYPVITVSAEKDK